MDAVQCVNDTRRLSHKQQSNVSRTVPARNLDWFDIVRLLKGLGMSLVNR